MISKSIILFVSFYRLFISPFFPQSCLYRVSCSQYMINVINLHGLVLGLYWGTRRLFSCCSLVHTRKTSRV